MPGINDGPGQVERIIELAEAAGATSIGGQALFLRGSTRRRVLRLVTGDAPDLVERYEALYRKGAYLSPERAQGSRGSAARAAAEGTPGTERRALQPPAAATGARAAEAGAGAGATDDAASERDRDLPWPA